MGFVNPSTTQTQHPQPSTIPSQSISSASKSPPFSPTSVLPGYGTDLNNLEIHINNILHDPNATDELFNAIIEPFTDPNLSGIDGHFATTDQTGVHESRASTTNRPSNSEFEGTFDHMQHLTSPRSNSQLSTFLGFVSSLPYEVLLDSKMAL
ncbi:hypothetical protein FRX31_012608 [Thalictrum thalictroides]|uniref:Uncharacterized protein n=1 Tax=Thalictrum thalictroides TaxID=46969 RepID=A0A7J6WMX3_THATH|nr:hypothetical protein FRX31_012608 [Thalictrum thalictroides]